MTPAAQAAHSEDNTVLVVAALMRVGIPALAGLSVLHGVIPPHPGPLATIISVVGLVCVLLLNLVL